VSAELIEQEAIRLFGERTYPVVGMRDIGEAVGLLPGSLYVHISSKEELLLRITEQGINRYLEVIEPVAASDEPASTRLRSIIVAHMRVLATAKQQTRVAFEQWVYLAPDKHQQIIDLRTRYENAFSRVVADGVASGEFAAPTSQKIVVFGIIGMLTAAPNWYSPAGALEPVDVGEVLADLVLRGLQASPA
jgi:TetR/AcrR family transcriptional regulator, cholesterol catabolism regulator